MPPIGTKTASTPPACTNALAQAIGSRPEPPVAGWIGDSRQTQREWEGEERAEVSVHPQRRDSFDIGQSQERREPGQVRD